MTYNPEYAVRIGKQAMFKLQMVNLGDSQEAHFLVQIRKERGRSVRPPAVTLYGGVWFYFEGKGHHLARIHLEDDPSSGLVEIMVTLKIKSTHGSLTVQTKGQMKQTQNFSIQQLVG